MLFRSVSIDSREKMKRRTNDMTPRERNKNGKNKRNYLLLRPSPGQICRRKRLRRAPSRNRAGSPLVPLGHGRKMRTISLKAIERSMILPLSDLRYTYHHRPKPLPSRTYRRDDQRSCRLYRPIWVHPRFQPAIQKITRSSW